MNFTSASRFRAHRAVVEQVCDAILSGEVQVGDMLPSERDIGAQARISRSAVREAMAVLQDSGMVQRKQGRGGGTRVIVDLVPVDLLGRAMDLSHRRIMQMLEVRKVLEITSAELAAARAAADQIQALEGVLERAKELLNGDPDERELFPSLDPKFHVTLAGASQNEVLFGLISEFSREVAVAVDMIPTLEQNRALEVSSMSMVVQAVKRRSPTEARIAMSIHLSYLPPMVDQYFRDE